MIFEAIRDKTKICQTVTHPKLYPHLSDDFSPEPEDWTPALVDGVEFIGVYDGDEYLGLFMFVRHSPIMWEVHTALLPSAWGPRATRVVRELLPWAFEHFGCERIITQVPDYNTAAASLALKAGMAAYGRNLKAYQKDHVLHDIIMYGASKCQ